MGSRMKKRPAKKTRRGIVPEKPVSTISAPLKEAKLCFQDLPPSPPGPKKIHPRRQLPTIPDDNS